MKSYLTFLLTQSIFTFRLSHEFSDTLYKFIPQKKDLSDSVCLIRKYLHREYNRETTLSAVETVSANKTEFTCTRGTAASGRVAKLARLQIGVPLRGRKCRKVSGGHANRIAARSAACRLINCLKTS